MRFYTLPYLRQFLGYEPPAASTAAAEKSESETLELLGGEYDYGDGFTSGDAAEALGFSNPTVELMETIAEATAEPAPSYVEEPPPVFPGVTPGINPDESQGGSNIEDPEAAVAAAAAAQDVPQEDMVVTANRAKRDVRPFQDQDFLLMHAHNLVKLRNEKMNFDLEDTPPDKLEDVDGDKKPDDVMLNTIRSIKGSMPYAYVPVPAHPKEVNAVIQCVGDPGAFTNFLRAAPDIQQHLDLTTEQLSDLTAKIRLYKLFKPPGSTEPEIVEFIFETAGIGTSELEEMMMSKGKKRGYGVGIKSFNFVNQSKHLHNIDRQMHAELVLFADSLDSLLQTRIGSSNTVGSAFEYRFTDLAVRSTLPLGTSNGAAVGSISDLAFQIMIEVGITKSASLTSLSNDSTSMLMKLIPKTHDFTFNQDGTVEMKIEYNAVVESAFAEPVAFDIFKTTKSLINEYVTEFASIAMANRCGGKEVQSLKTALSSLSNVGHANRVISINDGLRHRGKIYYINISDDIFRAWNDLFNNDPPVKTDDAAADKLKNAKHYGKILGTLQGALGSKIPTSTVFKDGKTSKAKSNISSVETNKKKAKEMQNDMEDKKAPQTAIRDCAIDPNSNQVAFFYVGDLVNLILENISDTFNHEEIYNASEEAINILSGISDKDPKDENDAAFQKAASMAAGGEALETEYDTINEMLDFRDKQHESLDHFKKLRVILGPIYIYDYFSDSIETCSIGDIPISLRHFNEWLTAKVAKNVRYPLTSFLNDFLKQYLQTYLRGNLKLNDQGTLGRDYLISGVGYTGYGSRFSEVDGYKSAPLTILRRTDPLAAGRKSLILPMVGPEHKPLINQRANGISTNKRRAEAFDYLVYYQSSSKFAILPQIGELERLVGFAGEQLRSRGIGAYYHGRDRGIVKDIQYSKVDSGKLKAALANSAQLTNLDGLEQFRELFAAKLTTFANFDVSPGDYIFIDPESINSYLSKETREALGTSGAQYIGVGGFFTVKGVTHSFEQGKFETTIDTNFAKAANAQYSVFQTKRQKIEEAEAQQAPNKKEKEEREKACKALMAELEGVDNGTLERAQATVSSIFSEITDTAISLIKAIFDNADSEISENDVESAIGGSEINTVRNPDKGNENSANNGPTT